MYSTYTLYSFYVLYLVELGVIVIYLPARLLPGKSFRVARGALRKIKGRPFMQGEFPVEKFFAWKEEVESSMTSISDRLQQRGGDKEKLLSDLEEIADDIEAASAEVSKLGSKDYLEVLNLYLTKFPLFPSKPKEFSKDLDSFKFLVAKALRISAMGQGGDEVALQFLQQRAIDDVRSTSYRVLANNREDYLTEFSRMASLYDNSFTGQFYQYLAENF